MPRSKKSPEQRQARRDRDRMLAAFWTARIKAGLKVKEDYVRTAKDVVDRLKARHDQVFDDPNINRSFMSFSNAAKVSVPTVPALKNSLAPRLYHSEPARTVSTYSNDLVIVGLCKLLETYLNRSVTEVHFSQTLRRAIDDGLLRGRAFLRQEWDEILRVVKSSYVSSLDVIFDPDFTRIEDAQWIAIRHREPLWQTKRRVPEKRRTKGLEGLSAKLQDEQETDRDPIDKDKNSIAGTSEIVEFWEVLSKMGAGFRGMDLKGEGSGFSDTEDFVRLEVVPGHDRILVEGDWDVPLYLDRDWPISHKDMIEVPDVPWSESIYGQVLSAGNAVDLLTTLKINGVRHRERVLIFGDAKLQKSAQDTVRNGTCADYVAVEIPPGMTLESLIKVVEFGVGSPETGQERAFLLQQMEIATGVTSMVTGAQDNNAADRSATATSTRNDATETRLGDFRQKVNELATDAARKEALMVRLFLTDKDVARLVRASDIGMFFVQVTLAPGVDVPVRQPFAEDDPRRKENVTLQDVYPSAATYFLEPQNAIVAAQMLWQQFEVATDPQVIAMRDTIMQVSNNQIDPTSGLPSAIQVGVVTPERVWFDTAGMSIEEILRETNYKIAVGNGIKFNKEAEQKNVSDLLQTIMPVMLQNMDYQGANKLLDMRNRAFDVPPESWVHLQPPPPPSPMPGQGEQNGPPKGKGKK